MSTQNLVAITGNTYPVKDQLKALGARWNGDLKAWMVAENKAEEARKIVAGAGPARSFVGSRSGSSRYYGTRNRRGVSYEDECELCGKNKYTCGHCIGW